MYTSCSAARQQEELALSSADRLILVYRWSILLNVRSILLSATAALLLFGCYNFNRTFRELPTAPSDLELAQPRNERGAELVRQLR